MLVLVVLLSLTAEAKDYNVVDFGAPCHVFREINEKDDEYYFPGHRFADQPPREENRPVLDFMDE